MVNDDKSLFTKDEPKTVCDVLKDNLKDLTVFVHEAVANQKKWSVCTKRINTGTPWGCSSNRRNWKAAY